MSKLTTLNRFLEFKKTSVKTKEKLQDIERYMKRFIEFSKKPLDKYTEEDLVKFINSLEYSIRTVNGIKAYLKTFIKWYYEDYPKRFRNLDNILKQQSAPRTYSPSQMINFEDIKKIVEKENNLMWKSYWLTLFYGGFRPSEAASLKWNQIYFEPEGVIIKIRTSKTKKDFIKSLPKEAEQLLKELKNQSSSELVFPSPLKENSPILSRTACARLKRVSTKAIGKEVTPYILRHSIATLLYKDDKRKDDDIANQLGHTKSMRHTYKNMSEEDLKEQARKLWIQLEPLRKEEREQFNEIKELVKALIDFQLIKDKKNKTKEDYQKLADIGTVLYNFRKT